MRRGRAVAGLAMIGLAVVIFTGWSPWSWASPWSVEEQREELAAGITVVRMDVGSGDVMIRTGDRTRTSVTAQVRTWWWRDGDPAYRRDGDTLVLTGCRGCSVDYELVAPRGTAVSGSSGSGSVVVQGVREVDVELCSGDIRVRDVSGPNRRTHRIRRGDARPGGRPGGRRELLRLDQWQWISRSRGRRHELG